MSSQPNREIASRDHNVDVTYPVQAWVSVVVRPEETDSFGHMTRPAVADNLKTNSSRYLGGLIEQIGLPGCDVIVFDMSIQHLSGVRHAGELQIGITILAVSKKWVTSGLVACIDEHCVAMAQTIHCLVCHSTGLAMPIPDVLAARLRRMNPGHQP